jgi:predicted metalloprotease with PDZ domain
VSRLAYGSLPTSLGNNQNASTHLQGELLGAMMDLAIRSRSNGRRSIDDLMRAVNARFGHGRGFTVADIRATAESVCACSFGPLFDHSVTAAGEIDFNHYLALIGLRADLTWTISLENDGRPAVDLRAYPWLPPGATHPVLSITDTASNWGQAGLRTGDSLITINGRSTTSVSEVRAAQRAMRSGDTVHIEARRGAAVMHLEMVMRPFDQPVVRISELPDASPEARSLRQGWLAGTP